MSLRGDDRGVVIQVGAILLFAFVILAITMYQVQVIPDQNKEIEYNHNEQVQDQLLDVRSGILTTAGGGGSRSVSVTLGTNYPSRTIFLNPSPPSGELRTIGTTNESINVRIANAKATRSETSDFWNGTNRSYSTGALVYEPFYHRYGNAPTTIYEHSLLVNQFDDVALAKTDQTIVQDETITLVTLNGSYQEASTRTVALDTQSLSTSTETIEVTNDGGNLTLSLPTLFGNETWEPLLEPELVREGGNVSNYKVLDSPNGPNTLIIEFVHGTYTLQMAKVGVGSNTKKPPESAHYITSQDTNKSLQTGGTVSLTVEVRDRYNNPVDGETVTIESPATPQTAETGSDGKVTFTYDAPDTPISDAVTAHIDGNASEEERVVFTVNVISPSGGGGSGGGGAYTVDWRNPTSDNPNSGTVLSSCSGTSCTWDVGADNDDSLNLTAVLNESIGGLTVDFGVNNSSVGYVPAPRKNQTDSNGEAQTDLIAQSNGTVAIFASSGGDSDKITITVENVTRLPAGEVAFADTNGNGVYDEGETTYSEADLKSFSNKDVDLIIERNVSLGEDKIDITANTLEVRPGVKLSTNEQINFKIDYYTNISGATLDAGNDISITSAKTAEANITAIDTVFQFGENKKAEIRAQKGGTLFVNEAGDPDPTNDGTYIQDQSGNEATLTLKKGVINGTAEYGEVVLN